MANVFTKPTKSGIFGLFHLKAVMVVVAVESAAISSNAIVVKEIATAAIKKKSL